MSRFEAATSTGWRLNAWQHRGDVHPFTCGRDSQHRVLVATREGWVCEDCDYRQDWAHDFMAEPWEK